jgi:hypothetical protein
MITKFKLIYIWQIALDQEVMGSNPGTLYWMNVIDLLAITLQEKFKIKVAK